MSALATAFLEDAAVRAAQRLVERRVEEVRVLKALLSRATLDLMDARTSLDRHLHVANKMLEQRRESSREEEQA